MPEDLSIIGIGDFKGSKEMEPGLTIIRIPARSIGKISGDQLARQIINNARDVLRTNCEITLTQRQTCAPLTT